MGFRVAALAALLFAFAANAEARTWRVAPGPQAQAQIQEAMIRARPGDTIRLARGRFDLTDGLSLAVDDVTVRGEGQDRTVLSFTHQSEGAEGLLVTSDRVTLRDFGVENTRGDAIKARDCHDISMINLRAEWTRGPNPENGSYGLYPVNCENVLIDRALVRGASDAGIYVGQSRNIIVRDSIAEYNVAGIEIENCFNADVFRNLARHNTGGILVFDLPGLPQQGGHDIRVFNNVVTENNTVNFAPPGNIVAQVPTGTGMLIMANRNVHIFDNEIGENGSVNILVTAYRNRIEDTHYNPIPRDIAIYDNRFGRHGFAPGGTLAALAASGLALPDILWDGATTYTSGGTPHSEIVRLWIDGNSGGPNGPPTYLSLGLVVSGAEYSDAQPDTTVPSGGFFEAPRAVRLPHD